MITTDNIIKARFNKAWENMEQMPTCKKFYGQLVALGYKEQADTFKDYVFATSVELPTATDKDIFVLFISETEIL